MQVISGKYKNQNINTLDDERTHPMGSREKLALFNMIYTYLPESRVLDAFAGSGALGIEALSRGALHATFVENNRFACKNIADNLKKLNPTPLSTEVIANNVEDYAKGNIAIPFDVIFADPPYPIYNDELIKPLFKILAPGGILVLSHPHENNTEAPTFKDAELLKSHTYAAATISIYKKV